MVICMVLRRMISALEASLVNSDAESRSPVNRIHGRESACDLQCLGLISDEGYDL